MYRSIAVTVEGRFSINHLIRFLSAGCAVQVSQRQAVNFTLQYGKIRPYFFLQEMSYQASGQSLADSRQHLLFKGAIMDSFR